MKKLLNILLILIYSFNYSYSQNFNAGAILGLSTTQVSGDNLAGFHKAGLLLGGFVNRDLNSEMNIQIEMTFIQKGSVNQKREKFPDIANINLNYSEVPLIIKLKQSSILQIDLGIQIAALINGYYSDLYGELENQIKFNKLDLGALIGISYYLNPKVILNTRLSNSIIPIAEHQSGQSYYFNKGKYNTGINFSLQYQL